MKKNTQEVSVPDRILNPRKKNRRDRFSEKYYTQWSHDESNGK